MKKLSAIIAILVVFSACSNTIKSDKNNSITEVGVETKVSQGDEKNEGKVIYLTKETFKQKVFDYEANEEWKYEGSVPCIVDFYADWCGPCKQISPILDELAKEYDGKIIIYKVNTDKERELSAAFGVRSLPSLLFIPTDGQPQLAKGAMPKEGFVNAIKQVLLKEESNEQI